MINGILLIILGILAVPSLILSRKPNAQELLDKITPYQGWIGVVFCIWGVFGIISSIMTVGWISHVPILWATILAINIVTAALGFILGYGLINKYVLSKNETAAEKGAETLKKLSAFQGKLGIAAIALGIWCIVASILWTVA